MKSYACVLLGKVSPFFDHVTIILQGVGALYYFLLRKELHYAYINVLGRERYH